jgi:hypothetical protein
VGRVGEGGWGLGARIRMHGPAARACRAGSDSDMGRGGTRGRGGDLVTCRRATLCLVDQERCAALVPAVACWWSTAQAQLQQEGHGLVRCGAAQGLVVAAIARRDPPRRRRREVAVQRRFYDTYAPREPEAQRENKRCGQRGSKRETGCLCLDLTATRSRNRNYNWVAH